MATPRFNRIALAFMAHINDYTTESGGIVQAGSIVNSVARIESYVNRALLQTFNDIWTSTGSDKLKFMSVCPELVTETVLSKTSSALPVPGNYFDLISARYTMYNGASVTRYIRTLPKRYFYITLTGVNSKYAASEETPYLYEIGGILNLLPATSNATLYLEYIQLPVKSDGSALTSGGDTDSPFTDQWNETIAEAAYKIFLSESDN